MTNGLSARLLVSTLLDQAPLVGEESPGSVNLPHRAECARLYGRIAGIASIALHDISKAPSH